MKKMSKIFVLAIVLMVLCCIGAASAADNSTADEVALSDEVVDVETVDEQGAIASSDEVIDDNVFMNNGSGDDTSDEGYVIYVGHNTTENGNGSYENPFATLDLACANVNGEDKVTLKIFNGTYFIGSQLNFNTSNLFINGINGDVIIKNRYNDNANQQALGLASSSSNFTISNIIFDASNYTAGTSLSSRYFMCFYGDANKGEFINCTFRNFTNAYVIAASQYDSCFKYCNFVNFNSLDLFGGNFKTRSSVFKYCTFSDMTIRKLAGSYYSYSNASMDSIWFGQNSIPNYMSGKGNDRKNFVVPLTRYAIFSVSEKYLGNNQFEIIGKLTWNGTENQDGMENFQPMTFTISSNTGNIVSTVTLVNGTFKTNYTSFDSINKVKVSFGDEDFDELIFNTVNFTVDAPSIFYGEDQNITVNFPQVINSTVTISINNKTYDVKVNESDWFTYTIKDIVLKADTYIVNVTLNDGNAKLYGANSTTFTVSKISDYAFIPDIPSEAKVGDNKTVIVQLPSDATGTVTVYLNNKPFTKEASAVTEITISGLVAGDNNVTVVYSGSDKYTNKSVEQIITAEKVPVNVTNNTIVIDSPVDSNIPSVSINLTSDATGNLTVTVNGKNYTQELVNGSAAVTITDLNAGTYNAVVTYSGDEKYDSITKNITVTVNAIKTSIVAPSVTTTYNVAKKVIVTLKDANGNALSDKKVTVNVGTISKTLNTDANGQVSVDISSLVPKTYTATIKFEADGKYAQSTATAKVVVNKAKSKITAKKATFKAKKKTKKYTITLKAGKKAIGKVKVTLKVKGKTYKATTNSKGMAIFKITKLTKKGKHNAVIKFKGNNYYKASSKKVKLTIKK